jgi:DNA-binding CsgD family transcriptional regulator
MTRLVFVDEEKVVVLDADLPATELVDLIQSGGWQAPEWLRPAAAPPLRAVRLGRLVLVSPAHAHSEMPPDPSLPALTLSPRQHQVLQGLADGLTQKEIAAHLGLHVNTVRLHYEAIKNRFGTTSRMQSVLRGVALGLCRIRPNVK